MLYVYATNVFCEALILVFFCSPLFFQRIPRTEYLHFVQGFTCFGAPGGAKDSPKFIENRIENEAKHAGVKNIDFSSRSIIPKQIHLTKMTFWHPFFTPFLYYFCFTFFSSKTNVFDPFSLALRFPMFSAPRAPLGGSPGRPKGAQKAPRGPPGDPRKRHLKKGTQKTPPRSRVRPPGNPRAPPGGLGGGPGSASISHSALGGGPGGHAKSARRPRPPPRSPKGPPRTPRAAPRAPSKITPVC